MPTGPLLSRLLAPLLQPLRSPLPSSHRLPRSSGALSAARALTPPHLLSQAGRPFVELVFTDLEVQFVADGEPAVHSESGGLHRCVFLNDCTLLDADSGEELLYKPLRGERDPASELCPLQVVVLGPLPGSQLALESAAPQASASVRVM